MTPLAAHLLIPNGSFVLSTLVALVVLAVIWVWPLVAVGRRQQWGWFVAIFILGPIAALVWLMVGRRHDALGST